MDRSTTAGVLGRSNFAGVLGLSTVTGVFGLSTAAGVLGLSTVAGVLSLSTIAGVLGLSTAAGVLVLSTPAGVLVLSAIAGAWALSIMPGVLGRSDTPDEGDRGLLLMSVAGDLGRLLLAMMPPAPLCLDEALEAIELHTDLALSRTEVQDRSLVSDFCPGPRDGPPAPPLLSARASTVASLLASTASDELMSFLNSVKVIVLICSMLMLGRKPS